ncbi:MAG: hypothetical protein IJZ92_04840 [Bacteroidaceae bacterium]|nr:hypothetical protein [Bacteroidaceae bacterium]
MKNIYVAPKAEQINILSEGVVAASALDINKGHAGGAGQLSQKRGWSADEWTAEDEE